MIDHVDVPAVRRFAALSVAGTLRLHARGARARDTSSSSWSPVFAWANPDLAYRDRRRPTTASTSCSRCTARPSCCSRWRSGRCCRRRRQRAVVFVLAYLGAALRHVHGGTWGATLARGVLVVVAYFGAFFVLNLVLTLGLIVL